MDVDNKGEISKNKLIAILSSNKFYKDCYNLGPENVLKKVWKYPFKKQYTLDLKEFIDFLKNCKEGRLETRQLDEAAVIEKIFRDLDRENDLVVRKGDLI